VNVGDVVPIDQEKPVGVFLGMDECCGGIGSGHISISSGRKSGFRWADDDFHIRTDGMRTRRQLLAPFDVKLEPWRNSDLEGPMRSSSFVIRRRLPVARGRMGANAFGLSAAVG
jgi:hypothetical protein